MAHERRIIRLVAGASFLGTAVESYDFFLYGIAAALVFPKLFFPSFAQLAATIASFATFGVAFIARPFGGIVLGRLGDRMGRKSLLVATLLVMGGATFLIGLLPTFDQVGVIAPISLVVLRLIQGFAAGGEWGAATLLAFEHAPERQRNFYASWPQLGVPVGLVLSTAAFGLFASLPQGQFLAWGWRAAFLLSIVLTAAGLCVRLWLEEPPVFADIQERGLLSRAPVLEVLRNQRVTLTLAIGIVFVSLAGFYIVTTFSLSYLTQQLDVARHVTLAGNMVFSAAEAGSMLLFAYIADRLGRGRVAICIVWCLVLFSYPYFWLLSTGDYALIWLSMGVAGVLLGALYGLTGAFLADLFEPRVRCSGISLGYQLGGLLAGAPAPLLCTLLIRWSGGKTWPVATYLAVSCLITLVALYAAVNRKGASRSAADSWPAVRLSADP